MLLVLTFMSTTSFAADDVLYSQKMADSQMQRSGTVLAQWDYPNGLFVESLLQVYDFYGMTKYSDYAVSHANATVLSNGSIGLKYSYDVFNIDYVNPGMFLIETDAISPSNKYKTAMATLRKQLANQPRNSLGGLWHKLIYDNQMWLDGLYMGQRFYAAYETKFNTDAESLIKSYDDIVNQFTLIFEKTYDEDYQLCYHAWSETPKDADSFWATNSKKAGCSLEFWGRGMGWYFAALIDVINIMPESYAKRKDLIDIAVKVAAGVKRWQDSESGCWFQLLRYDGSFRSTYGKYNYLEASASSMFTYAMLKGVRIGVLPQGEYIDVATKAYKGLIANFVTEDNGVWSLNRICKSAGLGPASSPSRTGNADYYLEGSDAAQIVSNDLKGVGPFIMASVEYERYQASLTSSAELKKLENNPDITVRNNMIMNPNNAKIKVFNSRGLFIESSSSDIDMSGYPKGVYVVRTQNYSMKVVR